MSTAKSRLMDESCLNTSLWINPCWWWIWPKSFWCLPLSPTLSLPTQFTECYQKLVRSEETCFLSYFHHFMSGCCAFRLSSPSPGPFSLTTLWEKVCMIYTEGAWEETKRREGAAENTLVWSQRDIPSCWAAMFHNVGCVTAEEHVPGMVYVLQ